MKALTYHGSEDVWVDMGSDPTIYGDDDIVLRLSPSTVGGADLHIERSKIPMLRDFLFNYHVAHEGSERA